MRSWTLRYAVITVHPGLVLYLRCVANVNGLERDVRLICHVVRQIELVGRISHGDLMDLPMLTRSDRSGAVIWKDACSD